MPSTELRQRILVIEDDSKMAKMLQEGIAAQEYQVETAGTGEEGFFLLHRLRPDLLILDLHLPKRSGMEILRQIRGQGMDVKVLILTSQNSIDDRVLGLEAGADDYLGKPFSFPELLARIRSLLRRRQVAVTSQLVEVADLSLDTKMRVAQRCGTPLDLTTREFDLLLFLAEHRNRTVSREMLARDVWQENSRFTPIDNVIDVQMTRLRRKSASRTPDRASPLKITTNSSTDSSSAGTRSPRRTAGPASASPSRNSQSNAAEDGFISSLPLPLEHAAASSFR